MNIPGANQASARHILKEMWDSRSLAMTDEIYAPSPDGHEGTRAFVASCLAAIHNRHNEGPFCDTLIELFDGRLFGENGGLVVRPLMPIGGRIVERTGDAHARPV